MARHGRTAPGGSVLVRCERHQRARHHRGTARGGRRERRHTGTRTSGRALAALRRSRPRCARGAGERSGRPRGGGGRTRVRGAGRRLFPGHRPGGPGPARRGARGRPRRTARRPARADRRTAVRRCGAGLDGGRPAGGPVPGPGVAVAGHGTRAVRGVPGVQGRLRRRVRGDGPPPRPAAPRCRVRRGRPAGPDPIHTARSLRRRGRALPAGLVMGSHPRLPDGALLW